jgi:hypothetical protein
MTSVSGEMVEKVVEAANHRTAHPANPHGRAIRP